MDTRIVYMYILMILALFIGFLIGWMLRRNSYHKKYEDEIYELQYLEEQKFEELTTAESNLKNLHNVYLDNKDSLRIKQERLESYIEQDKRLKADIDETRSQNEAWVRNTPIVDEQIDKALENLNKVKRAKESFLAQIEEINSCEADILALTKDIEHLESLIAPSVEKKNALTKSLENLTERFEQQKHQFDEVDIEILKAKDEHIVKKTSMALTLEKSQIEEETCTLALEKIEDKLINSQELSKSDFKGVFKEENGSSFSWIDGIYSKSKHLLKGEK